MSAVTPGEVGGCVLAPAIAAVTGAIGIGTSDVPNISFAIDWICASNARLPGSGPGTCGGNDAVDSPGVDCAAFGTGAGASSGATAVAPVTLPIGPFSSGG